MQEMNWKENIILKSIFQSGTYYRRVLRSLRLHLRLRSCDEQENLQAQQSQQQTFVHNGWSGESESATRRVCLYILSSNKFNLHFK